MVVTKNKNRIKEGSVIADVWINLFALLMAFITLYPMYYVLILSLSEPSVAATMKVYWLPKGIYLEGYRKILTDSHIWIAYRNTIFYAAARTLGMLATCSMFGYALSYPKLKGKKFINMFLIVTMYFGGGIIPFFLLIMELGLYNTVWSLILPSIFSVWNIILVRSYFKTIPEAMRESAQIDGANHFQTLIRIYR